MAQNVFEIDIYSGSCSVCGIFQCFERKEYAIRETYRCSNCNASLREREQAQSILECYKNVRATTLTDLISADAFKQLSIYEPGTIGSFRKIFKTLANYHQSDFYAETDRANVSTHLPHQDLENLTYSDQSFDLVITSDILEHVRKPMKAFAEIFRVLKPGGYHVFTVPLQEPIASKTVQRVDTSGEVDVHVLPEHFHGNGKGGRSLVYTDFGLDIIDMLHALDFAAYIRHAAHGSPTANRVCTVISLKAQNISTNNNDLPK